jgi:hypothetical protein
VSWHEEPNLILALSRQSFGQNPVICCTEGEVLEAPMLKLGHLGKDYKRYNKTTYKLGFRTHAYLGRS